MTAASRNHPLDDAWQAQGVWSVTANRLKSEVDRARNAALTLAIVGAVLGALAVQLDNAHPLVARVLGLAAGVVIAVAPFVRRGANTSAVSSWTRARSVSEALKTEVFSYLAGGSCYQDADRDRQLRRRKHDIVSSAADLRGETANVHVDPRPLPRVTDVGSYIERRLNQQVDRYYRPKAALYQRRLVALRRVEVFLAAIGAALGTLAGAGVIPAVIWVPVAMTLTAALAAHTADARYQRIILEYLRTADQLTHLHKPLARQGPERE